MTIKNFGKTSDGRDTRLYILKNDKIELRVTDFGTSLVNLFVPDENNNLVDIVLGYDDALGYEKDVSTYLGCNVGRNANRISKGRFTINGVEYTLDINNGENNLHSGFRPYSQRI